ncbi:MAG: M28 family peptidase [Microgenomates group bacterium]
MYDLLEKLVKISPRFGVDEMKAAKIITDELSKLNIPFTEEPFDSTVPRVITAELFADGVSIPCLSSTFKSGAINNLNQIHFSPHTDDISVISFYDEPSVSVSKLSMSALTAAKIISGEVVIAEEKFTTENILVGNTVNPKNIIFAHFDSIIGSGALDNAAGVSLVFEIIKTNPGLLPDNLFVFTGNEEISYDGDDYDSHGYRVFESVHQDILKSASQIIIVDGVGVSSPMLTQEGIELVFLLTNLPIYLSKCFWLQNNQRLVLQHYHSTNDTIDNIKIEYLNEAKELLINKITL